MISSLSAFNIGATALIALLTAVISYVLFKFIFVPLNKLSFYKKQGLPTYFYPFIGVNKRQKEFRKKMKDGMGYFRDLATKDPNVAAEVGNFASRVTVLLYEPKLLKEFYSKQSLYLKLKPPKAMNTIMGTGLVLAEGNLWKNHRRIISSKFHFEFLKQNVPLIVATTKEFLGELSKTSLKNVHTLDEIQKITGEVIGRIFFGENLNQYKFKGQLLTLYLADLMIRSSETMRKSLPIIIVFLLGLDLELVKSYREFMGEVREFRQFIGKIIEDRKASKTKGNQDLLGVLLETQKSQSENDRFTDEDIINEFITFFLAGMDTTGHLITMTLYMLLQHPEVCGPLQKEIDSIYSKNNLVTIDELNQMDYLQALLKETLRLYTPVPLIFPRVAQEDHELGDLKIKKGTSVRPTSLYNQSNPKYFDEPEKFKPERWLNRKDTDLSSYAFIPFSAGARNCIGQHMAMIEAKIIICEFLKLFNHKVVPENYELELGFNFLYGPKNKMYMDLELK